MKVKTCKNGEREEREKGGVEGEPWKEFCTQNQRDIKTRVPEGEDSGRPLFWVGKGLPMR